MKIIAASIAESIAGFLHPGYISATQPPAPPPAALDARAYAADPPALQLELGEALRLQTEQAAAAHEAGQAGVQLPSAPAPTAVDPSSMASALGGGSDELWIAAAVFSLVGMVAGAYLLRGATPRQRARLAPVLLLTLAATGGLCWLVGAADPARAAPAPVTVAVASTAGPAAGTGRHASVPRGHDEGAGSRSAGPYARPELATLAILHGIIADALMNSTGPVRSLSALRDQVALPLAELTKGQSHALAHFTHDGWGRAFRLRHGGARGLPRYTVTSAGADGRLGTIDDLAIRVQRATSYDWPRNRHAFFLISGKAGPVVLFRAAPVPGRFVHRNAAQARSMTGSSHFDLLWVEQLARGQRARVQRALTEQVAKDVDDPVVLQVFPPRDAVVPTMYWSPQAQAYMAEQRHQFYGRL